MMETLRFFTCVFSLFLLGNWATLECIARSPVKKTLSSSAPNKSSKQQLSEKQAIEEIQSFLKNGKTPNLSFNDWCDAYIPTLITSSKEPVKKLGLTLQNLRRGNMGKISAFSVLPIFEKAVQEHDPSFRIKTLTKPWIITKGTVWYFSRSKKTK